jgi:WD40 repeat protein
VWDAETGKVILAPFQGHTASIRSVAVSPDNKWVVSGSLDKSIRVWPLDEQADFASSMALPANDKHTASSSPELTNNLNASKSLTLDNTATFFSDDLIFVDGWMYNKNGELLFWVPPYNRDALWSPRNTLVIGENPTPLDLGRFVHGTAWARCRIRCVPLVYTGKHCPYAFRVGRLRSRLVLRETALHGIRASSIPYNYGSDHQNSQVDIFYAYTRTCATLPRKRTSSFFPGK